MGHRRKHGKGLWTDAEAANEACEIIARLEGNTYWVGDVPYNIETGQPLTDEETEFMNNASPNGSAALPFTANQGSHGGSSYPGSVSGSPYTPASYAKCDHDGMIPEIDLCGGNVTIAGARGNDVEDWDEDHTLIIDLAGQVKLPDYSKPYEFLKSGPKDLLQRLKPAPPPAHIPPPPILRLDWADQGAPIVELPWWSRLLAELNANFAGNVIIACIGGHGRTGTAMACLMLVDDPKLSVINAVGEVRKYHCVKSIESMSQWKYLAQFRPKELAESKMLQWEAGYIHKKPTIDEE